MATYNFNKRKISVSELIWLEGSSSPVTQIGGTGWQIGDGFAFTAGHVVYEWNRSRSSPVIRTSETVSYDPGDYGKVIGALPSLYLATVNSEITTEGLPTSYMIPENENLESKRNLINNDRVIIRNSSDVNENDAGIVTFLEDTDLLRIDSLFASSKITRFGTPTGEKDGVFLHLYGLPPNGGQIGPNVIEFSVTSERGDSGSAYVVDLADEKKGFVVAVQSANYSDAHGNTIDEAIATFFNYSTWTGTNQFISSGHYGDQTHDEPTNMMVGSDSANGKIEGSFRADIILARGGDDELADGDSALSLSWADDQLFGGGGKDMFFAYGGNDLLHGGDWRGYTPTERASTDARAWTLENDGEDSVKYEAQALNLLFKEGFTLLIGVPSGEAPTWTYGTSTGANNDRAKAVYVIDRNSVFGFGSDTLISIENVTLSDTDDIVRLDVIAGNGTQFAGADGHGGIAKIDMGRNETGIGKGDLIDASRNTSSLKIDLSATKDNVKDASDVAKVLTILEAENVYGGSGDDEITGNEKSNLLIGGKGADKLFGGDGDDILRSNEQNSPADDGAVDELSGGGGKDIFYLDSVNDTVKDPDKTIGEAIYYSNILFTGGTANKDHPNVYLAKDGTKYEYDSSGGGAPAAGSMAMAASVGGEARLKITAPDGTVVYAENFTNGDAGIWLTDEGDDPDKPSPLDPEKYHSPLVLDLDGDGIETTPIGLQSHFDFAGDGFREMTSWIGSDDGFLAIDRNSNGRIDDASELFGSNPTDFIELRRGSGGMASLSLLDSNHDGAINSADAQFADLLIWRDLDGDGYSDDGELAGLGNQGITEIDLDYLNVAKESLGDGFVTERSTFTRSDGSIGEVADVWFRTRPRTSVATEQVEIDPELAALPQIGGSGLVRDLQSAMQIDPLLQEMVEQLVNLDPSDLWRFSQDVEAIVLRWTGGDKAPAGSRGNWFDARYLTALENWTGDKFVQPAWKDSTVPYPQASAALMRGYRELISTTATKLLAQIPAGAALLPELDYAMDAFLVLDPAFSVELFIDRAVQGSPTGAYEQIVYWHFIVSVAQGLADKAGVGGESLATAIDSALGEINPQLSYDTLRRMILGSEGNDYLTGTSTELDVDFSNTAQANWTLPDLGGIDWFLGGRGDDLMSGGYGRDTYVFGRGFGHDTVIDTNGGQYDGSGDQDDVVQLIGDLTLNDIVQSLYSKGGRQYARIALSGSNDYIDFELTNNPETGLPRQERVRIVAADGTAADFDLRSGQLVTIAKGFTLQDLTFERVKETYALGIYAPDGTQLGLIADYFSSTRGGEIGLTFDGQPITLQQIDIERLRRAQTSGADRIEDTPRGNTITGLGGDDVIDAGKGDDLIDGGAGADVLNGGRGIDTYLFGRGSGVDKISDPFGLNVVRFGANVALTDLQLSHGTGVGDLVIRIAGTTDQLVISDEFGVASGGIERFEFADGTFSSRSDLLALLPAAQINASQVLRTGTSGIDTLRASGHFTVAVGKDGQDIYQFNRGDGVMWIGDFEYVREWDPSYADIIQFGPGITADDLTFRILPETTGGYQFERENSVEIAIKGTSDAVRIYGFSPYWFFRNDEEPGRATAIDELRFSDGSSMNVDQIFAALQNSTSGNDYIRAWLEGAVLNGGAGNDVLLPGDGGSVIQNVTIQYGEGSGNDVVPFLGGHNGLTHTLQFSAGITPDDIEVHIRPNVGNYNYSDAFEITLRSTGETLSIGHAYTGAFFEFSNGQVLNVAQFAQLAVNQEVSGPGDSIRLYNAPYSPLSDEQTIHLTEGMGLKRVLRGTAHMIKIDLPLGYTLADLNYDVGTAPSGNLLVSITLGDSGDGIILRDVDWYGTLFNNTLGYVVPVTISDSLGNAISNAQIIADHLQTPQSRGTEGDDVLVGTSGSEAFNGNGGTDEIVVARGSGHDVLTNNSYPLPSSTYAVRFAEGIEWADLDWHLESNEYGAAKLTLTIRDTGDSLKFSTGIVTNFSLASGEVRTIDEVIHGALVQLAASANSPDSTETNLPTSQYPAAGVPRILIEPGAGNDSVYSRYGGDGNFEYVFRRGDGHDSTNLTVLSLPDVTSFDDLSVTFTPTEGRAYSSAYGMPPLREDQSYAGYFTLTIKETGDSISLFADRPWYLEARIRFADGILPDWSYDLSGIAFGALATNRDDIISDVNSDNRSFDGGPGNDVLDGITGGDNSYFFGRGDGVDTILENGWWFDGSYDRIVFKPDVLPSDIEASIDTSGNLIIAIKGTQDKLIIPSLVNRVFDPGIEVISFEADGSTISINALLAPLLTTTSGDDVVFEYYGDGRPRDRYSNPRSDVLDGGAGDDFLAGGAGSDFYVFGRGYGHDTILDKSSVGLIFEIYAVQEYYDSFPEPETDTLTFLPGITPDDLEFTRGGRSGDDLIIKIKGTGDQLTIIDEFAPLDFSGDRPIYAYDTEWQSKDTNGNGHIDPEEIDYTLLRYLASTPNGIEAFRFSSQQVLSLADIAAKVKGIDNSGDNDYVTSDAGGTLDGGVGNDELTGGKGDDDFVFQRGYGEDTIRDIGGYDIVNFGVGIRRSMLHFSRTGTDREDLLIEVDGPERLTLTIDGQFAQAPGVIEEFTFLNGEYLTWLDVQNTILREAKTDGNDTIAGFLTADVIDGGAGDDVLIGGKGNDKIVGSSGRDTAVFSGQRSDYLVEISGDHVIVTDQRIDGDGIDTLYDVELLRFLGGGGSGSDLELVPPNHVPTALNARLAAIEDTRLIILRADILARATDQDGDSLTLARVGNASGGRVWINLAGDIVFDPSADFFGTGGFDYTVADGNGGQANGRVSLNIAGVSDAPRLTGILQDISVDEDTPVNFAVPSGLFVDPDGDALLVTATLVGGAPLPDWLAFDGHNLTGMPPSNFNGTLAITFDASDGTRSANDSFTLTVNSINDAPVLSNPLADQLARPGELIEILVPSDVFSDADGDSLEISARQTNGLSLPDWLSFDGQRFTGIVPGDFQDGLEIEIRASDGHALARDTFSLLAPDNAAPLVAIPLIDQEFGEDGSITFSVPDGAFQDPDGDTLTYSAALTGGRRAGRRAAAAGCRRTPRTDRADPACRRSRRA